MEEKQCVKCGANKNVIQFGVDSSRTDGLLIYCKACACRMGKLNRDRRKYRKRDEKPRDWGKGTTVWNGDEIYC